MGTKGRQIIELDCEELLADLNKAYADYGLIVHILTAQVEDEDEFETLLD